MVAVVAFVPTMLLASGNHWLHAANQTCIGDCDGNGSVTVDELLVGVNILLGLRELSQCPNLDSSGDGEATIDEELMAVANAVQGCDPTPSPSPTPTPGPILTELQTLRDGQEGVAGLYSARSIAVSPDGTSVYIASESFGATIVAFTRDSATGLLEFLEPEMGNDDGEFLYPTAVAVSPDGHHVYATTHALSGDLVAIFRREPETGLLDHIGMSASGFSRGRALALSPDATHVYVSFSFFARIAVFQRDQVTGALDLVDVSDSRSPPTSMTIAPDGSTIHLLGGFVPPSPGFELSIFSRAPSTGILSLRQEVGGIQFSPTTAFVQAYAGLMSPDGRDFYVGKRSGSHIARFERGEDGFLSFKEPQLRIGSLDRANAIAIDPDGDRIYVAGVTRNTPLIAVVRRNALTGDLATEQVEELDDHELGGPDLLAVSPDGATLYAVDTQGILTVFRVNPDVR